MRAPQKETTRGSQKWLQVLINGKQDLLGREIATRCPDLRGCRIEWRSPLKNDEYAEYRDTCFVECIGLGEHAKDLREFWPSRGPQWDGLGRAEDGKRTVYLLVEAKANIREIFSSCAARSPESLHTIDRSLREAQRWLKAKPHFEWTAGFYQYANRLAHLFFLREKVRVPAYLINIHFVGDKTLTPTDANAWEAALELQKHLMGIPPRVLATKVIEVLLPVDAIG
jgi:hypothetical protein